MTSEKAYGHSFNQQNRSPRNHNIPDGSSQRHPSFPVRPNTPRDTDLKALDASLSNPSTDFLIKPVEYKSTLRIHLWGWIQEISCLMLSCISLLAVVLVLDFSNGQQQPKLPFAISLNTLVSYLGTIYKASLLGAVSSCVGQLKWCWYKSRAGLEHFDILDSVGRSPLTAFLIFFSGKPYRWIYFGAIILLLTAFVDPFLQQVISNPLVAVQSGPAGLPRAQSYDAGADLNDLVSGVQGEFDYGLKAAIYQGLFAPENSSDIDFNCPSGNCTYPEFDSLAFCSKCANITGQVFTSDNPLLSATDTDKAVNLTWRLPFVDPITIHATIANESVEDGPALVSVPFNTSKAMTAIGVPNPLVAFSILHWGELDATNNASGPVGNYSRQPPDAYQCAIFFCLKAYAVKASNGRLESNVTSTYFPPNGTIFGDSTDDFNHFANVSDLLFQRPEDFPQSNRNDTFFVSRSTIGIFAHYLQHFFTNSQEIRNANPFVDDAQSIESNGFASNYPPLPFVNDTMSVFTSQIHSDIPKILDGMTTTMTNYIRKAASGQGFDDSTVPGAMFTMMPLTRVDYRWLALPVTLVVSGIVLMVYTAILSAKLGIPIWKDSSLATLFHGLDHATQHSIAVSQGVPMTMSEMNIVAKRTGVVLQRNENGDLRLVE